MCGGCLFYEIFAFQKVVFYTHIHALIHSFGLFNPYF